MEEAIAPHTETVTISHKREAIDSDDNSNPYAEFCSFTPKKKMKTGDTILSRMEDSIVETDPTVLQDTPAVTRIRATYPLEGNGDMSTFNSTLLEDKTRDVKKTESDQINGGKARIQSTNEDMLSIADKEFDNVTVVMKKRTLPLTYPCQGPGCNQEFKSASEHDAHYNVRHRHICAECKRSLKSRHLLDLHLMEKHDSYFAILSQRKPMFMCLVETCTERFKNPEERQTHCLSGHPFLRKYLQSKSEAKGMTASLVNMKMETEVEPTSQVSHNRKSTPKASKVKAAITFGHQEGRFIPRQVFAMQKKGNEKKKSKAEMIDLSDLQNSLQS